MANIIITIQDIGGGKVNVVSNPTFEEMLRDHAAKKGLRPSHGYALCAINAILNAHKTGNPFHALNKRNKKK